MQLCLFFLQQERNSAVVDMRDHIHQFIPIGCAQVEKAPSPTGTGIGVLIEEDTGEDKSRYLGVFPLRSGFALGGDVT